MHNVGAGSVEPELNGSDPGPAWVLLVDPDPEMARRIIGYLGGRRYRVEWVGDAEKAFNLIDARPFDVLVTELNIPGSSGMRLMAVARERNRDICAVFLANHADIELATEAMRQGAYDFQIKPVNLAKLEAVIQRGLEFQRLVYRQHELHRRLDEQFGLGSLIGNSRPMMRLYDNVRQAAQGASPVLIQGEPGTGKDLIAQAIHNTSARHDERFVKAACSQGLPDSVLLGAPGGGSPGMFAMADKGTLFIEGLDRLTPAQQTALWELIRMGRFRRPADGRAVKADVRVVGAVSSPEALASVNPELARVLRSFFVEAPALRDRPEDIPLLVKHFLEETARQQGFPAPVVTRNALDLLTRYHWPENVRELRQVMESTALSAARSGAIDSYDIPETIRMSARPAAGEIRIPLGASMADAERAVIDATLKWCGYNKNACAKALGIGLRTLYRKLRDYDIR